MSLALNGLVSGASNISSNCSMSSMMRSTSIRLSIANQLCSPTSGAAVQTKIEEDCPSPSTQGDRILFETTKNMKIEARVSNSGSSHSVAVATDGRHHSIDILPKTGGHGSSINGGELLFAALATCFCNDLYREAAKRTLSVRRVDVEVTGTFGQPGEAARDISYRAKVDAEASQSDIDELIRATDSVAEIQNTIRHGCAVRLLA
jgi:organic hydroperoxide reductase OsmC/OhrA